jgi:hypothetical protein
MPTAYFGPAISGTLGSAGCIDLALSGHLPQKSLPFSNLRLAGPKNANNIKANKAFRLGGKSWATSIASHFSTRALAAAASVILVLGVRS